MEVLSGAAVVVLDAQELPAMSRQLVEAIRRGYVARGLPPPRLLLDLAAEISRAARGTAGTASGAGQAPCAEPPKFRDGADPERSEQPVTLTIREAAERAEVSGSYMRRLARRGDVEASRGDRSAWAVDADSLAAWLVGRRRNANR